MSASTKIARRRSVPIMAYTGANGHGKTFAAVLDTLPSLDAGRPVLSTVRLLDFRNPRPCEDADCTFPGHPEHGAAHPAWVPFDDWELLLEMRDCDVLMDEIVGVAGNRDTSNLPSIVGDSFQQMRRAERVVRWTAPAFGQGDIQLRRVTQSVTICRGSFGVEAPGRMWTQKRLFKFKTYETTQLQDDQITGLTSVGRARSSKLADVRPLVVQRLIRNSDLGRLVMAAYDTYSPVLRIGVAGEHGRCLSCGGRISVPVCKCADRGRIRRTLTPADAPAEMPARRGAPLGVRGPALGGVTAEEEPAGAAAGCAGHVA